MIVRLITSSVCQRAVLLASALGLVAALSTACGGKAGSGSAFGTKKAAVVTPAAPAPAAPAGPAAPASVVPEAGAPLISEDQVRQLTSIVGRTVAGKGTDNTNTPLPGVKIYAYMDKKKVETESDADGFFHFKDVPVMSEVGTGNNLVLYFERAGWELQGSNPNENNNSMAVDVRATQDAPTAFQTDLGKVVFEEAQLKVTTSLHHASLATVSNYLSSGGSTLSGYNPEVYLADPAAAISLTFNRPIDTAYSDSRAANALVEFYDPKGAPIAYTGTWDATKTIYTIDPTADLLADNDDDTNYRIVIARPVRAIFADTGAMHELRDVTVIFNVLPATAGDLLASQAPGLFPQQEAKTAYVFDAKKLYKKGLQGASAVDDYVDNTSPTFHIKWAKVANARGYNVYWRNTFEQKNGIWSKHNGPELTPFGDESRPDGTFTYAISNLYTTLTVDTQFVAGEQVQFVVTAVDFDGTESSINTVAQPLAISDTYKPVIEKVTNADQTLKSRRAEWLNPTSTRKMTLTFSELMDAAAPADQPTLAMLSGALTSVVASESMWMTRKEWQTDLALTFKRPQATLTVPAFLDQAEIYVDPALAGTFGQNDTILVKLATDLVDVDNFARRTISHVDTISGRLKLSADLDHDFPVGSVVRLIETPAIRGLTSVETKTVGIHLAGVAEVVITTDTGAQFHKGQSIRFVIDDEEGYVTLATASIDVVEASKLKLTAQLQKDIPAGATIVDGDVDVDGEELKTRASISGVTITMANDINLMFTDVDQAATNLASNFATATDTELDEIVVADATLFAPNDVVTIAASTSNQATTAAQTVATVIPLTAHGYQTGEEIIIDGQYLTRNISVANLNTAGFTVSENVALMAGETVQIFDPEQNLTLTATASITAAASVINVNDASGLVVGQSVTLDDGVFVTSRVITTIATNAVTLAADPGYVTHSYPTSTKARRAALGPTGATINGTSTTGATFTLTGAVGIVSTKGQLIVDRAPLRRTVGTIVSANEIPVAATRLLPQGTAIKLMSYEETFRIETIERDFNKLNFTTNVRYAHRAGAAVKKSRHDWLEYGGDAQVAVLSPALRVGDTIAFDTLTPAAALYANADRIFGVVNAIDTERSRVRIAIAKDGVTVGSTASFTFMGDAVKVSVTPDTSGNALLGTHSTTVNLRTTGGQDPVAPATVLTIPVR